MQFSPPKTAPAPSVLILDGEIENTFLGNWPDRRLEQVNRAELHSYRIDAPRAMALVCVGGGYTGLFYDKEGAEIALWLNSLGMDAHVLVHRLPGGSDATGKRFGKDVARLDGLKALDALAKDHPDLPLFHVGLSSGGHLSGVLSCHTEAISAHGVLITYAPLNANHRNHKVPADKPDYPPLEKQDFYDDWPIGLEGYPHAISKCPVFLAYALTDTAVPVQHALRFVETAAKEKLDLDAHIFGTAPHGFALRSTNGSQAAWPDLAAQWFERKLAS